MSPIDSVKGHFDRAVELTESNVLGQRYSASYVPRIISDLLSEVQQLLDLQIIDDSQASDYRSRLNSLLSND